MKITKTWTTYFLAILMLLMLIFPSCGSVVYAEQSTQTTYSYVLDDLSADENFSETDYPFDETDYSLYGISATESSDGELFIYVYQPSQMFEATRVSMSVDNGENYIIYNLTLLNSSGVFYKYKLSTYTILEDETRTYHISSIYRAWSEEYDGEDTDNVEEISYKFGLFMTATGQGAETVYTRETMEVITITDMVAADVVGYDTSGLFNWMTATDNGYCSHVVAFNTDIDIDKVYEAEVYAGYHYASEVVYTWGSGGYIPDDYIGEEYFKYITLSYDEVTQVSVREKTYTFNRIMSVEDYLAVMDIDSVNAELSDYTWVLCLSEAEDFVIYSYSGIGYGYTQIKGTLLDEATILRLSVDIDGAIYNLGVVSNLQSSSVIGDGATGLEWLEEIFTWLSSNWQYLVYGLVGILALIFLAPFIPSIVSILIKVVCWLFKGIWKLIELLAKGLVYLVTAVIEAVDSIT